ncbi:MAG TPA: hypothetical protein VFV07_04340 [Rhizomicrobium sp.]|nr:hypothetical protein [Rhizomicrobium sp.]
MRGTTAPLPALIFFAVTAGAMAQVTDPKSVPVTPVTATIESKDCPETSQDCKIICKEFPPKTGSRLGGHTECRTKHFWDDRTRQDQAAIVKLQIDATHLSTIH